jgi:NDP-sugar pyrophosphorylase family protein
VEYKVLIPSAGLGTRLGESSKNLNKALVSVDNKPVISHVIEKFSEDVEIIVAVGHKGDLLKDYLSLAHPDRKIVCVDVDCYHGRKSGLGYSILKCEEYLQCPFIFISNDTLVVEDIPAPDINWIAYSSAKNTDQYRSIQLDSKSIVKKIYEKDEGPVGRPYIGLSGINDYKSFWNFMRTGITKGSIAIGESYALRKMLSKNIEIGAKEFTWYDTGTIENLKKARKAFARKNSPNILEKSDEAIWFVQDRVIKYSIDQEFIFNRVKRSLSLNEYVPEIIDYKKNMYSYKHVNGHTMSNSLNAKIFKEFLEWSKKFWILKDLSDDQKQKFRECCLRFYKDKTYKRVKQYFNRFSYTDSEEIINGIKTPKLYKLLDKINWDSLSTGVPTRYHGDFHFENILVAENGDFILLDWRQDFGGLEEYGDIYYDLSKLLHGSIVPHEMIGKDLFTIDKDADIIKFDILRRHKLIECERIFEDFIYDEGYDLTKVRLLTALIFLNIAPLHHYPYSEFLFYLGKYQLNNILNE